jgi:DNA-binding SARP family transcriptional activator
MIEIRLLGRFAARRGGEEIPPAEFGGRLVRTLIRVLVTRRGRFVPRDVLAEALWPGRLPADPAANLKVLVNRARRALGDPSLIVTGPRGYSFAPGEECLVDAEVFEARVKAGRDRLSAGQPGPALCELQAALELWAGEPLAEDAYEEWAQEHRARLGRAYQEALEGAALAALSLRDTSLAVAMAAEAAAREPLREPAWLLLMRAHAAGGDAVAALAAFETLRRGLTDELGLDPSPAAYELEGRIVRGEPLGDAIGQPAFGSPPVPHRLAFVGRHEEMDLLLDMAAGAAPGPVAVSGPAGAGKSRLLEEVAGRCPSPVLFARAFRPDREDPWGLARPLLREAINVDREACRGIPDRAAQALADIVPDLEDVRSIRSRPLDPESRRALAIEGGVRLLEAVASRGAVLMADDLQWADPTSLALLRQLMGRVPTARAVLAYRPEEVTPAVSTFLDELEMLAPHSSRIRLGPLPAPAIADLVADRGVVEAIVEETDLTAFAVAEVILALAAQRLVEPDAGGRWRARGQEAAEAARSIARSGQRRAVRERVVRQPPARQHVLSLLALLGRETPARILATAAGRQQEATVEDLGALAHAGLARLGDLGWAVAHDVISATVADDLEPAERTRLHHLLARALTVEGAEPSQVALHLEGAGDLEAAATLFAQAARLRLSRFETDEAARLAEAGMRLTPDPPIACALLEIRAEARDRRGDAAGARQDLRTVLSSTSATADRSRILARLAMLTLGTGDNSRASRLVELALAEAGTDPGARAQALAGGSIVDLNVDRLDRAEARSAEALSLFHQIGDARGAMEILDCRASITLLQGRVAEFVELADEAVPLFCDVGDLLRAASLRAFRGLALIWMKREAEGLADLEESLETARSLSHPEGEARSLWLRGEALAALGRPEQAVESAQTAVGVARRIGNPALAGLSLVGLGLAWEVAGDLGRAEAALVTALEDGHDISLVRSAAATRLASVLLARGELERASTCLSQGLSGVPLIRSQAELLLPALAMARGEPNAWTELTATLARAEARGWAGSPMYLRVQKLVSVASPP